MRNNETETVSLATFQEEHNKTLSAFYLPENQMGYSALPEQSLRYCDEDPDKHPIVVLVDEVPVGFFVLHIGKAITPFTDNERAILLRGFLIDHNHQGKKYGMKALKMLPGFATDLFPRKDCIVLAVNVKNVVAKALYLKSGFQDTGVKKKGRSGWMHIMEYRLSVD
ncbi:GNAT family N-acetyltransferase [Peribacillus sp. NPDC097675]|uniref:GNAT family N-acetyltransferase n=1 Tax=Peribacillus sp. NPDC097675 TaxID=3390618 RepID=UPI003CFDE113